MRPVIVKYLDEHLGSGIFSWIVPDVSSIYSAAIFVCALVFIRRVKGAGLSEYHAWGAMICGTSAGIIGVRVWYLLMNVSSVVRDPTMLWDLNGATVSFGGYFLGAGAFIVYLAFKKESPLKYMDAVASCLGLGPMIARWACFMNGDDFGTVTSVPWAVSYPPGSYAFADHVNRGLINLMADHSLPVHPVQLYLSLDGLVLFIVCSLLWKRGGLRPGYLFGIFWGLYSISRFTLEFTRGDYVDRYWSYFTSGQVTCTVIMISSIAFILGLYIRRDAGSGLTTKAISASGT